jgi:predicted MFS family arabinose efflux permease
MSEQGSVKQDNPEQIVLPPPGDETVHEGASLRAFYADRPRMWSNVFWITFGHFGMALSMTIVEPLMNLRLKAVGVSDSGIGLLVSANLWAVSFLVMYFSWKSDHTISRLGRRTPFVLLSLPFLTIALLLFPLFNEKWLLMGLMLTYFFFNDVKASTYPLLAIDCASKDILARVSGLVAIMTSLAAVLSSRIGARIADVYPGRVFVLAAVANLAATLLAMSRIKEPPIHHPTSERFNFLAPIRIASRDKRILVLMIAVALLNAFPMVFKTWVWFYAKSKLGLSIGETGAAMSWGLLLQMGISYPGGWLIDRFGGYVTLILTWCLMFALAVLSIGVRNVSGLIVLTALHSTVMSLKVAGDAILWKTMDKADTGSYTSTVALCRNFCTGTVIAISGFLIKWTGSYVVAFWFGFVLSTIALIVFFVYRHLMREGGGRLGIAANGSGDAGYVESASPA